jgi:hypothetical protein
VQCGYHVTEFLLIIKNQGLVKQEFHEITLRARGIERGTAPALWDGREPRLAFPLKIFQEPDVIYRRKYGHVFVEPGVVQTITYVTRLPETVGFVQVRAEFHYTRSRTHSAERVFEVPSPGAV